MIVIVILVKLYSLTLNGAQNKFEDHHWLSKDNFNTCSASPTFLVGPVIVLQFREYRTYCIGICPKPSG